MWWFFFLKKIRSSALIPHTTWIEGKESDPPAGRYLSCEEQKEEEKIEQAGASVTLRKKVRCSRRQQSCLGEEMLSQRADKDQKRQPSEIFLSVREAAARRTDAKESHLKGLWMENRQNEHSKTIANKWNKMLWNRLIHFASMLSGWSDASIIIIIIIFFFN